MIIYNPSSEKTVKERINQAELLLAQLQVKHCFITGSFLYREKYQDIDIFVVTRTKRRLRVDNKKAKITRIDFNDLYSLFYHSLSKSCLAKDILPLKPLKVTLSDYWQVINEAVPTIINQKNKYHKDVRFLILYTEYFKTGSILDTFQLDKKIRDFKDYQQILEYIKKEVPEIINKKNKKSYLKKFFYTQAGFYKDLIAYPAQKFLYQLTHSITGGLAHG